MRVLVEALADVKESPAPALLTVQALNRQPPSNLSQARDQYWTLNLTLTTLALFRNCSYDFITKLLSLFISIFEFSPLTSVLTAHRILPWEAGSASSDWLSSGRSTLGVVSPQVVPTLSCSPAKYGLFQWIKLLRTPFFLAARKREEWTPSVEFPGHLIQRKNINCSYKNW